VPAADVDDAPPAVSAVRVPRENTLRRQLADQEADGRRRDLQPLRELGHGERPVEEQVGQQRKVPWRQLQGLEAVGDAQALGPPDDPWHQQQQLPDRGVRGQPRGLLR
jgi:hypothetical protein